MSTLFYVDNISACTVLLHLLINSNFNVMFILDFIFTYVDYDRHRLNTNDILGIHLREE